MVRGMKFFFFLSHSSPPSTDHMIMLIFYLSSHCSFHPSFLPPIFIQVSFFNMFSILLMIIYDQTMATATTPIATSPPMQIIPGQGTWAHLYLGAFFFGFTLLFITFRLEPWQGSHNTTATTTTTGQQQMIQMKTQDVQCLLGHNLFFFPLLPFYVNNNVSPPLSLANVKGGDFYYSGQPLLHQQKMA